MTPVTLRYKQDQPPPKERDGTPKERDRKQCHVPQRQYNPPSYQDQPLKPAVNKIQRSPSKTSTRNKPSAARQKQDNRCQIQRIPLNIAQPVENPTQGPAREKQDPVKTERNMLTKFSVQPADNKTQSRPPKRDDRCLIHPRPLKNPRKALE